MPSTYTLNNGIELIATGEQSGTWGDTTNTNLELLDTALDGQVTVTLASAGSSGSPNTLPISDGAASNGRNRMVIFDDSSDLGATAYVQLTPNDAEKIIYVRNSLSGSRSILFFQGTYSASNDYEVPAGTTAILFFDGAGSGAVAANVFNNAHFDALNVVGQAKITTGSGNTYPTASTSADELIVSNLTASAPSGITIFSDNASSGNIFFGDEDDADNGRIVYDHSTATGNPSMAFSTSATEAMRIDSSQRVLIGDTTGRSGFGKKLEIMANDSLASISLVRASNSTGASAFLSHKARGTLATPLIVQDDDNTLQLTAHPYDGTDYGSQSARISMHIDGTPGANDTPGRIMFETTADGASTVTERMRITQAGNVEIGFSDSDVNGKLNVKGDVGIRNYLATSNPTGGAFSFTDPDSSTIIGILRVGDDDGSSSSVADLQIISYGSADDDGGGNIRFINARYSKETGLIKSSRQSTNTGYMDFYTENGSGLQKAMRIDSGQQVLIGALGSSVTVNSDEAGLQLTNSGALSHISQARFRANSSSPIHYFSKSRSTTTGTYGTIVQDADAAGQIIWTADDGVDSNSQVAAISANVDGTPGANDMPGRLVFSTTSDGASSVTERMRINNEGYVKIGDSGDPSYLLHVGGSTGGAHFGYDKDNNDLWLASEYDASGTTEVVFTMKTRSGGNWRYGGIWKDANKLRLTGGGTNSDITTNTTAITIDEGERLLIGLTSDIGTGHGLQVNDDTTIMTFEGTTTGANGVRYIKSRASSAGSNTVVADGDDVGFLDFRVDDGTDYASRTAIITSAVDGTPGTNDTPGRLVFYTTADGSSSSTERMRIDSSGKVLIGTTTQNFSRLNFPQDQYIGFQSGNSTAGGLRFEDNGGFASAEIRFQGVGSNQQAEIIFSTGDSPGSENMSERARITNNGITFNGDTAAANALDDYEEGTFVPAISFDGGTTGIVYNIQAGRYTKVGNMVTVWIHIYISNKGSSTGQARIGGLPYTITHPSGSYNTFAPMGDRGNLNTSGRIVSAYISTGNDYFPLYSGGFDGSNNSQVNQSMFENITEIDITLSYPAS